MKSDPNYDGHYAQAPLHAGYGQPAQPTQVPYDSTHQEPVNRIETRLVDDYIDKEDSEEHSEERFGFMQKVYSIVTIQLLITFLMTILASFVEVAKEFFQNDIVFIVGLVGMIIFLIFTFFAKDRVPLNYITLFGFTLSMGTMVSGIASFIEPEKVFQAILLTVIISVALTIATFAMGESAILWVFFLIICLTSVVYFLLFYFIFTSSDVAYAASVSIVGVCYGLYLVIDTYIVKSFAEIDDYIIAAVIIYIDIIRIFIIILALLGSKK